MCPFKSTLVGAGEMAQWLKALTALREDPGSVLSTYTAAHNYLKLQFQGIQHPHTDIHEGRAPMYVNIF